MKADVRLTREPVQRFFRLAAGLQVSVLTVIVIVQAAGTTTRELTDVLALGIFPALLVGVAAWVLTLNVSLHLDDELRAQVWPLPATSIPRQDVVTVTRVTVEPLGEFGSFGLFAGRRDHRLLGLDGSEAVRVVYAHGDSERTLTISTRHAAERAEDVRRWAAAEGPRS